jgi:hypothetical protein
MTSLERRLRPKINRERTPLRGRGIARSDSDTIVLAVALPPIVLVGIILNANNRCILHLGFWFAVREIVSAGKTAKALGR